MWAHGAFDVSTWGSPKHFSGNVPASVDESCDLLQNELMEILMAQEGGLIPWLPP